MIKRIVKLTFREDAADTFIQIFQQSKATIKQQKGCSHLELWRDTQQSATFFTYSYWDSEEDLNTYRQSDFFAKVWPRTKALLAEKPLAWSVQLIG